MDPDARVLARCGALRRTLAGGFVALSVVGLGCVGCADGARGDPDPDIIIDVPFDAGPRVASAATCALRCTDAGAEGDSSRAWSPDPRAERRDGCLEPTAVNPADGVARLEDIEAFADLAVSPDGTPGRQSAKYSLHSVFSDDPWLYFITFESHAQHFSFSDAIGCDEPYPNDRVLGEVIYLQATGEFEFTIDRVVADAAAQTIERTYRALVEGLPSLADRHVTFLASSFDQLAGGRAARRVIGSDRFDVVPRSESEPALFVPLNSGLAYGRLRFMDPVERPEPLDIVVYETVPPALPRVAGIITTFPQTPLSHVNLRAIQDGAPNAYIDPALVDESYRALDGEFVSYEVSTTGFALEPVSERDVLDHAESLRPWDTLVVGVDVSAAEIVPLDVLSAEDAPAFGAKAANLGALLHMELPEGVVPTGYAVPLSFYFQFMAHNGLDAVADDLVQAAESGADEATTAANLRALRQAIRYGAFPEPLRRSLTEVQEGFPEGAAIRCRSSANAEDQLTISGAGVYDSTTHRPDEGHIEKSIRRVYESLWSERAFAQRTFYRIDPRGVGMGVLLHENFDDEQVNGVAVSFDPFYGFDEGYTYVNAQVGENLVTNPDAGASVEETIVVQSPDDPRSLVLRSAVEGGSLLSNAELVALSQYVADARDHLAPHYGVGDDEPFEIEVEFKITRERDLVIKQARPWVFHDRRWTEVECIERCP